MVDEINKTNKNNSIINKRKNMTVISKFFNFLQGPALFKIYFYNSGLSKDYERNLCERLGERSILAVSWLRSLIKVTALPWAIRSYVMNYDHFEDFQSYVASQNPRLILPLALLLVPWLYLSVGGLINLSKRHKVAWAVIGAIPPAMFFYGPNSTTLYKLLQSFHSYCATDCLFISSAATVLCAPWLLRAIGRSLNPHYRKFLNDLYSSNLKQYEFDFNTWPVDYSVKSSTPSCGWSSYNLVAIIALKMIYPGYTSLINYFSAEIMRNGRSSLIDKFGAERFKVHSCDGNDIDVIFVNRQNKHVNGNVLVVVCEGNCGFYECGSMMTAVDANYSVVGWNHPGFGGSTGRPFPSQEKNAIDAVMEFSIEILRFSPENILLYGWSIGGFTSSWAARKNPNCRGLILDATFDNILPLAETRVPNFMLPLATYIIKNYINLDVLENVKNYAGPVTFIRRSNDEMICTREGDIATNRCNPLVLQVLKHRYPNIIDSSAEAFLKEWLSAIPLKQAQLRDKYHVDKTQCISLLNELLGTERPIQYPVTKGGELSQSQKLMLTAFLVDTHLKEYKSTHCVPLPVNMFREPTI